jgi:hypothetical protein
MKNILLKLLFKAGIPVALYFILLQALAGTNIIAGIFCPGSHLPHAYPLLIALFLFLRIFILLLPGLLLSRIVIAWLKNRFPRV